MCGIAGIMTGDGSAPSARTLDRLAQALREGRAAMARYELELLRLGRELLAQAGRQAAPAIPSAGGDPKYPARHRRRG